jgi:hypothetical protein
VKTLYVSIKIRMGEPNQYRDPVSYGELERTKRLINAVVRLWELRQKSPQYSSPVTPSGNGNENQSNRLPSSALTGSSRSPSIAGLASDSQGERAGERSETDTAPAERPVIEAPPNRVGGKSTSRSTKRTSVQSQNRTPTAPGNPKDLPVDRRSPDMGSGS